MGPGSGPSVRRLHPARRRARSSPSNPRRPPGCPRRRCPGSASTTDGIPTTACRQSGDPGVAAHGDQPDRKALRAVVLALPRNRFVMPTVGRASSIPVVLPAVDLAAPYNSNHLIWRPGSANRTRRAQDGDLRASGQNAGERIGERPCRRRPRRPRRGQHRRRERDHGRRRLEGRRRPDIAAEAPAPNTAATSATPPPTNGCAPATISCSTTHKDQTSSASSAGRPESTSGDR